jgi:hypothetical protein
MSDDLQPQDLKQQRAQAVRTAWVLGIIAMAIFAIFIGSAIIGR